MSKAKLAIIALIVANLIWGAASPIFKWSLVSIEIAAYIRRVGVGLPTLINMKEHVTVQLLEVSVGVIQAVS